MAFYGCIADAAAGATVSTSGQDRDRLRIYACFGTVVLKYYRDAATAVLLALSECLSRMPQARALISLGGADLDAATLRRIEGPNVEVASRVDQWAVLGETDLFVTHNGMNSTHEAIFRSVPMLSYPFFMDQPALAERCRQFGMAIPLAETPRAPIAAEGMRTAIARALDERAALDLNLSKARSWELEAIANRPSVLDTIESFI